MDIVEISYIDTDELYGFIHESFKQWRDSAPLGVTIDVLSKRIWKDDVNTKAIFYCPLKPHSAYRRPLLIIDVEYDEVNMVGKIEFEYHDLDSEMCKDLVRIFKEVFGSFDSATAPLPFGVKCPHCSARYVYKIRTGTVICQNCLKPFELEYQKDSPLSESDTAKVRERRDSTSRYVALDRSKIAHCKWCGTVESSSWKHSRYGNIYCSSDCLYADSLEVSACSGFCILLIPLMLFLPLMRYSNDLLGAIPVLGIFGILSLAFFYFVFKGFSTRSSRPKNSRRPR